MMLRSQGDGAADSFYFVEPYLSGRYVKHSSNYGYVGQQLEDEDEGELRSADVAGAAAAVAAAGAAAEPGAGAEEGGRAPAVGPCQGPAAAVGGVAGRVERLQRASLRRNPRQTPHSFSYFSWHATGGREVVSDVQGLHQPMPMYRPHQSCSKFLINPAAKLGLPSSMMALVTSDCGLKSGVGDIYTDPQIHSLDPTAYGPGNHGLRGIVAFLSTHLYTGGKDPQPNSVF